MKRRVNLDCLEWLDRLEEPERTYAFRNLHSELDNMNPSERKVESISEAVSIALKQWQATPQGFDYWRNIHNKYFPLQPMRKIVDNEGEVISGMTDTYMPQITRIR